MSKRIGLVLVLLSLAPAAHAANEPVAMQQQARKLYAEGEAAFTAGRFVDAVRSFQAAYELSHAPKLLWNIAQSWRRQYQVTGDVADLRRARAVLQNYRELADSEAERAEATQALVEVDGAIASEEDKGRAASAAAAAAAREAAAAQVAATPRASEGPSPRALKLTGLVLGVAGVALVGTGAALGVLGLQAFQRLDNPRQGYVFDPDDQTRSRVFRPLGWTLVGVGAAALAGGVTSFVLGTRGAKAVSLLPVVTDRGAGLTAAGAF